MAGEEPGVDGLDGEDGGGFQDLARCAEKTCMAMGISVEAGLFFGRVLEGVPELAFGRGIEGSQGSFF